MRSRTVIVATLSLIIARSGLAIGRATEAIKPLAVAKPQVQQLSSGCGSPNVGENSGRIQIKVTCSHVTFLGQRTRMNSLEINQERLLLAKNPTELRITKAYLRSWLPDHQRISLTLAFENPRDIPIPEIEVDFLDPGSGPSIQKLKPISLTPSQVYREYGSRKFSLGAGDKTALPVAFLDEIVERTYLEEGACAFDAALTTDSPRAIDASQDSLQPNASFGETKYKPLLVRARFKSIFGQELSATQWIWIVYGRGSEGRKFWYPSEERWGKLVCVH